MPSIDINLAAQRLWLISPQGVILDYAVSTALNGPGEKMGSECTPRGRHQIRAKIGKDCPVNTVFAGRRPTGELYTPSLRAQYPKRDWILTRILWLSGLEPGRNRFGDVDTMRRFIYIHGCPDETVMGTPNSHGCIRMRNQDILALFNRVCSGTIVEIH